MINLLPSEVRQSYHYARRNRTLLPWITALIIALVAVAGIGLFGNATLAKNADSYNHQISLNQTELTDAHVDTVKTQITDISNSLSLVVNVLKNEILFSKLLTQINTVIPTNVNLTGLSINQDDSAISLTASAKDYNAATQLQANLVDPANKMFSKADLVSITCNQNNNNSSGYPCTAIFNAEFSPSNQFLFIGKTTGSNK